MGKKGTSKRRLLKFSLIYFTYCGGVAIHFRCKFIYTLKIFSVEFKITKVFLLLNEFFVETLPTHLN